MLEPGEQLHHYVVEERVGGGGTATVYRVRHQILQQAMALKVLDPALVGRPDLRMRFLAEGRIQARVRHPAIVMVTDTVVDAPRRIAGLVMEYVEGPNLAELISRMNEPPSTEMFRSLALPLLEGLHHAHQEGVLHRDIKPSNVLVSRDAVGVWHPRLADFGIAHVFDGAKWPNQPRITQPDAGLGTPAFMAPEQIAGGEPAVGWDIFAVGVLLYELATGGVHPFERDTHKDTLAAIVRGHTLAPSAFHPEVDRRIEDTILAALAPDPADRARSCAELIERLHLATAQLAPLPPPPAPETPQPIPPTFVETAGEPRHRQAWRLQSSPIIVGREDADIEIPGVPEVEARHCVIRWLGSGWLMENTSRSGTRVNGARIDRIPLENGDLIRVGHQVLKFHTTPAPPPVLAPSSSPTILAPTRVVGPRLAVRGRDLVGDSDDEVEFAIGMYGVVIGRGPEADIMLAEPNASPEHCRVVLQGLDVVVEDLQSSSGTFVDGQPVRFRRLMEGAVLRVGHVDIHFRNR